MKQIKTISKRLNNSAEFDEAVNKAIEEGWTLTERKVLQPQSQPSEGVYIHVMLYAELERFTEPDECEGGPILNLIENLAKFTGSLAEKQKDTNSRGCGTCKSLYAPSDLSKCPQCSGSPKYSDWEPRT